MMRKGTALVMLAACALHAQADQPNNPETVAERSQATARAVLDQAVAAIGGAEALRSIEVVRLRLEGENWPRLQMPTASPPFEAGTQRETLLLDLKNSYRVDYFYREFICRIYRTLCSLPGRIHLQISERIAHI